MNTLYQSIEKPLVVFTKENNPLPFHMHRFVEIIYVTGGRLQVDLSGHTIELEQGDMAVLFPGVVHGFHESKEKSFGKYILYALRESHPFYTIMNHHIPENPVVKAEQQPKEISMLMEMIAEEQDVYLEEMQIACAELILSKILPAMQLKPKTNIQDENLIYQLTTYLGQNFREEISLSSLAKDFGISPYTISRVFSKDFGINFNQYLNGIRVEYAAELLVTTREPITEIFMNAGFTSQCTFNRAFRIQYGMTPAEFRKEKRNLMDMKERTANLREDDPNPWNLHFGHFYS